jgi:hypothetical protein
LRQSAPSFFLSPCFLFSLLAFPSVEILHAATPALSDNFLAVGQFHDLAEKKTWTTKDTKYHAGFSFQEFPSCTFVPLAVMVLAN